MSTSEGQSESSTTNSPKRPQNALHEIAGGIGLVIGAPGAAIDFLNTGIAGATNAIAQAVPAFPAATLGSIVMGAPHAHAAHPPSGPPPVPPTPLPPIGPVTAGCCIQVLINGIPAARCGDIILNPTCCGIPPLGEIKTGSSNVFIGGARAARLTDISMHCTPAPSGTTTRAATAMARAIAKAANVAGKVMQGVAVAGVVAQASQMAGDAVESVEADNSAMSSALALNVGMMAGQMAADAVAMALGAAMGKDQPILPPTGTPGAVLSLGSGNVLIGGIPMPSTMDMAKGLLKMLKGLRRRGKGGKPKRKSAGCTSCAGKK